MERRECRDLFGVASGKFTGKFTGRPPCLSQKAASRCPIGHLLAALRDCDRIGTGGAVWWVKVATDLHAHLDGHPDLRLFCPLGRGDQLLSRCEGEVLPWVLRGPRAGTLVCERHRLRAGDYLSAAPFLGILFEKFNATFLVGWAFNIAASANEMIGSGMWERLRRILSKMLD